MCFVIAGVQPKTKSLDDTPRRCPRCGLFQAYHQRVDHYLSLFFIPLFKVKTGEPFLYCRRCQLPVSGGQEPPPASSGESMPGMCRQCGRSLEKGFMYCPYCGQRQ